MQHLSYVPEQFIPEAFFTGLKPGWLTNVPLFVANQLVAELNSAEGFYQAWYPFV